MRKTNIVSKYRPRNFETAYNGPEIKLSDLLIEGKDHRMFLLLFIYGYNDGTIQRHRLTYTVLTQFCYFFRGQNSSTTRRTMRIECIISL